MQPDFHASQTQIASTTEYGAKLTYEDYVALTEDDQRYELIGGEMLLAPSPSVLHQMTSQRIFMAMRHFVDERNLGEVFYAPLDVVLSEHDVVQPDILFISKARLSIIKEAFIDGPPDLVVEVMSQSNPKHDMVTKQALYDKYGIREYWVVDPGSKKVNQLVNSGDGLKSVGTYESDIVSAQALPGFAMDLPAVFRR